MELAVSSCYLSDAVALFSPGFCSGFCHLAPHEHAVLRLIVIIFGSSSGTPQHLHSIRCECSAQSWKITARSKSGHNNPRTFLIMELYQGSTNRKHVGTPRRAWVSSLPTNHISPWQRRGVGLLLGYTVVVLFRSLYIHRFLYSFMYPTTLRRSRYGA